MPALKRRHHHLLAPALLAALLASTSVGVQFAFAQAQEKSAQEKSLASGKTEKASPEQGKAAAKAAKKDAQQAAKSAEPSKPAVVAKLVVGDPLAPDDFALRYYASQKQKARVNAELARLKRLYPNYEPPADLYEQPGSSVDEQALWDLYSADKIDELKALIAQRQKEHPEWKPSADLSQKLRRKELRMKIGSFFKAEKFLDLVDYVTSENVDLGELTEDVDIVWSIAEAYARAKQNEEAVNAFKRALTNSKDTHIRIATIQKAMGSLRMADVEKLLDAAPGAKDGSGEFAPLAIDLARARIAAFLHDERSEEVSAAEVAKFEAYAKESRDANQTGLVAWYDYKRRDYTAALDWFKLAIQNDGDAMVAHGLAHTLRSLGLLREAEEVAFAWHEPLANNIILFLDLLETDLTREIPPYIEAPRLARYAKVTMEAASGEGAQALAWYAYNSCQFDVALFWFERAVAWFPKDATVYGYALTLRRMKRDKEFYELANRYDGLFAKVIEILFPDGYVHPPTPCDQKTAQSLHGPALRTAAYIAPGPATIPGALPNYDPQAQNMQHSSAPLSAQIPPDVQLQQIMKTIKGRFPVAVSPANRLRFSPLPILSAAHMQLPSAKMPVAPPTAYAMDPVRTPPPLVARRVPGVGPMPYERFGFSLLPGWNGVDVATIPSYWQQAALRGSQWASQTADPSRAGIAVFDMRSPGNARGLPSQPYPAAGPPPVAPQPQPALAAPQPMKVTPAPMTPSSSYAPPYMAPRPPAYGQYPQPLSR